MKEWTHEADDEKLCDKTHQHDAPQARKQAIETQKRK
jgi:hypothetical protein